MVGSYYTCLHELWDLTSHNRKFSLFHYICLYELWDLSSSTPHCYSSGKTIFLNQEKKKKKRQMAGGVYKLIKVSDPKRHVNQKRPKHAPTHTPCNLLCGLVLPFDSRADLAISYTILPFTQSTNKNTFIQKERKTKIKIKLENKQKGKAKVSITLAISTPYSYTQQKL